MNHQLLVLNSFQQAVGRELSVKNSKLQGSGLQLNEPPFSFPTDVQQSVPTIRKACFVL